MQRIRLFLASPGDVEPERTRVAAVVEQLNRMLGDYLDVHLDLIEWKTHVAPDMGRPQAIINQQIGDYDIFVGIMWKRFGTPTGAAESGTEEEFNLAYANWQRFKRPRILFYFSQLPYAPKSIDETEQWGKVLAFKAKLQQKGLIREYQSAEEFAELLREHLAKILQECFGKPAAAPPVADFSRYLNYLKEETMYIDIRGLITGESKAPQFRIDRLYIPLQTSSTSWAMAKSSRGMKHPEEQLPRELPLQDALQQPRLIIRGDPGAGKTTFLRFISFALCQKWLGGQLAPGMSELLWPELPPLPILIRLGRLVEHIQHYQKNDPAHCPTAADSPEWVCHFLEAQSREFNWQLPSEVFRCELDAGHCLILLDGLDEAPDATRREQVSNLAANLFKAFPQCRVVLTSRPAALVGPAMPAGFTPVDIAPLDDPAIETFLAHWSHALYPEALEKARAHQAELYGALQSRPEIRRMAHNPVMLTALAVVHWNEHRLPEQRSELYESILTWLLRARAQRSGRLKADRCRKLLQKLALALFLHPEGRQRGVNLRWAAEKLAPEFSPIPEAASVEQAEYFLRDEMVDSGIIVERAHRLEFWHLSFQEYLAAYEIAGMLEKEQFALLFEQDRLYQSEWRELLLLLGGVLYKQGETKINHLIDSMIIKSPKPGKSESLPQLARTVGLLGGVVHDLSPFDFQPTHPAYSEIVRSVMGIFDKTTFRNIPLQTRIEAADVLGRVGDPRLEGDPMVYIPGGRFWMGAQKRDPKGRNYDSMAYEKDYNESPVHQVELSAFYISRYPITVGQYRRFLEDRGYADKKYWQAGGFGQFEAPDKWEEQLQYPSRPVVYVSWYEAAAYAVWAGGGLPTEAQWERAARGPGQEYRKYPWGNTEPDGETTNFNESKINHVTPVGIFPESCSPEAVIELAGNVWEWCWDWFSEKYYQDCAKRDVVKDPLGPQKGEGRVVRGGAFDDDPVGLRCAYRVGDRPHDRYSGWGFRVVRGA